MTKLNYLLGGFLISTTLLFTSCGEKETKTETKNSPEFNILASVKNPVLLISIDIMDLLKKSNVKESKDMPAQFKMIVNSQIERHFNSENQGFKLEGDIPIIVSSTENNDFDYVLTYFDVLDAEKIGPSLCLYFSGKVEKLDNIYILEANIDEAPLKGHFVWDTEKLIFVGTESSDSKTIALNALANKSKDAPDNSKITGFLAQENDFSSLLFTDNYTKTVNKLSETKMGEELIASYEGLTVSGAGNFNDGNFIFTTDLDGEKFINSKYNNLNEQPIDKSFYNFLTDNNQLIAFGASSLNIEAIANYMSQTETEFNLYDEEFDRLGLKKEHLSEIFNGDFSASLIDVESIPTEGYEGNVAFNQDRPKALVTCGIKSSEKLNTVLKNNTDIKAIGNYFQKDDIYFGLNEDKLFVSLTEELIKKLTTGEKLSNYNANINKPIYANIITDMEQLPEGYKSALLRNGGEELLKFYNQLESITFNGDIHHTEFKIEFTDRSTNSFEIIANAILKNILPLIIG